ACSRGTGTVRLGRSSLTCRPLAPIPWLAAVRLHRTLDTPLCRMVLVEMGLAAPNLARAEHLHWYRLVPLRRAGRVGAVSRWILRLRRVQRSECRQQP